MENWAGPPATREGQKNLSGASWFFVDLRVCLDLARYLVAMAQMEIWAGPPATREGQKNLLELLSSLGVSPLLSPQTKEAEVVVLQQGGY